MDLLQREAKQLEKLYSQKAYLQKLVSNGIKDSTLKECFSKFYHTKNLLTFEKKWEP
jgi:hypothetical protein